MQHHHNAWNMGQIFTLFAWVVAFMHSVLHVPAIYSGCNNGGGVKFNKSFGTAISHRACFRLPDE